MRTRPAGVPRRRRGVALVFALFTTAVLITMSLTFVALSMRHGQTSTASTHTQSALHAANWALDYALNFMGDGANWEASVTDASGFTLSYHLTAPKTDTFQGLEVKVEKSLTDSKIRTLSFPRFTMPIDSDSAATLTVDVQEIVMSGQPTHYRVQSKAEVKNGSGELLATRVVEARVREQSAADFLHFVQNARSWDAPGVDPAGEKVNDLVGIPAQYRESGKMRVDGGGPVEDKAGRLRLYNMNDSNYDVRFEQNVTIQKDSNLYANGDGSAANPSQDRLAQIFSGGTTTGATSLGLPARDNYVSTDKNKNGIIDGTEKGYAPRLAEDTSGGSFLNGHIEVGGSNSSVGNGSSYADVEYPPGANLTPGGQDSSSVDARPGLATVEIILNGSNVTVKKVGRYSKKEQIIHNNVPVSKFKNGMIVVDGGNVKIRSEVKPGTAEPIPFTGRLTVVSNEQASRNPTGTNAQGKPTFNATSIYNQAARDYYDKNPHDKPPYSASTLGLAGNGKYWPPPAASVEREGNTILASDIKYGQSGETANSLGVVSKNFVLLNDETAGKKGTGAQTLAVDAVLMSLDHSVQFDWDNLGDNPAHASLMNQTSGNGQRTFKFNGAVVGGFLDVEGDVKGRGYSKQQFTHDENLRYNLPPAFPRWDRKQLPPGVVLGWVIMQFVDRGTVSGFR